MYILNGFAIGVCITCMAWSTTVKFPLWLVWYNFVVFLLNLYFAFWR